MTLARISRRPNKYGAFAGMSYPHQLAWQVKQALPTVAQGCCALEYRFHPTRKWKFDVAWPTLKLAVEVDGGGFVNGRHSRGTGLEKDAEKFAEAAILGWTVIRCTPKQVKNGTALAWVDRLVRARQTGKG